MTDDDEKLLHASGDLAGLARELDRLGTALPRRVNADPEQVEKGLAQLVLTLVELLRQLMERQALRRIDGGSLTPEEVERLGETFMLLEERMEEDVMVQQLRKLERSLRDLHGIEETLEEQLEKAVANEEYEAAARIRDALRQRR